MGLFKKDPKSGKIWEKGVFGPPKPEKRGLKVGPKKGVKKEAKKQVKNRLKNDAHKNARKV